MSLVKVLKPTKKRGMNKKIFGFDIETCDDGKTFVCASIVGDGYSKTFYNKRDVIKEFQTSKFKGSFVSATNLQYDYMGVFFNEPEIKKFSWCWRGSHMIFARSFIGSEGFHLERQGKNSEIVFIDTLNYAQMSVNQLGKLIGYPKMVTPEFIGKMPQSEKEWVEMVTYNKIDAEVSRKGLQFLYEGFISLGATPKYTIASTSVSLFTNKYLKEEYYVHDRKLLKEIFKSYYGGRVEVRKRGLIKGKYNYYDFNSLYPSVMRNDFPNPNSVRDNWSNSVKYIESFDGVAEVTIYCPEMDIPLLPVRHDGKLYFPTGSFKGFYTNIELRKALSLGYVIKKVHRNIYYKEKCSPFREFVEDLYKIRKEYKSKGNPLQMVTKILSNSLYGKFAEKFWDRETWTPYVPSIEEINKCCKVDRIGEFFKLTQSEGNIPKHCFPIWASYVSAYGRIKLYDVLVRSDPVYYDTDSIVTTKEFVNSSELGELKLENEIKLGIYVRPKFYMYVDEQDKTHIKIKGLGRRITHKEFITFIAEKRISYLKFMKFKEAVRRGFIPNETMEVFKEMSLQDNKRLWEKESFDLEGMQTSKPVHFVDGKPHIEKQKSLNTSPISLITQ